MITLVDREADISMAFTANEEENSGKKHIGFEYNLNDFHPNIHFLQEQMAFNHYYKKGYNPVILDVLSPPPKQAQLHTFLF